MNGTSKAVFATALCLVAGSVFAGSLKITEKYDEFTKETYLQSKNLTVCQPRSAGMVPCATLVLSWYQSTPSFVGVRIEIGELTSMTEIAFNIGGEISKYEANSPVTDMEFDASQAELSPWLGERSSNLFVVPLADLNAVTESPENGMVRVAGLNDSSLFDFYRKYGFGKAVPADKLRDFVTRVGEVSAKE